MIVKRIPQLLLLILIFVELPGVTIAQRAEREPITIENAERLTQLASLDRHLFETTVTLTGNMAWSPDNTTVAVAGSVGVYLYDIENLEAEPRLWESDEGPVCRVPFAPDGTLLAVGYCNGIIRLHDSMSGEILRELERHIDGVSALAFSPDGTILASGGPGGGRDDMVRLWNVDLAANWHMLALGSHMSGVRSVAFSPDGTMLATSGSERVEDRAVIRLWDVAAHRLQYVIEHPADLQDERVWVYGVDGLAFAPDGATLAAADIWGMVRLFDVSSGDDLDMFRGFTRSVTDVAYHPDGTMIAAIGDYGTLRLWDAQTGEEIVVLGSDNTIRQAVAFSPDGTLLITGGHDNVVYVWGLPD